MKLRLLGVVAFILICTCVGFYAVYVSADRTPGELLRYAERRLLGHPRLENVLVPAIQWFRRQVERPVPVLAGAVHWRGASTDFMPQADGYMPLRVGSATTGGLAMAKRQVQVRSASKLVEALRAARPGDVIEIMPGRYRLSGRSVPTYSGGLEAEPITVRAPRLGQVVLEFDMLEGFFVEHPYWIFENLEIAGVCGDDGSCEHAFHVVGNARSTVIRNNRIRDFNAQIKVNGAGRAYPDSGVIQFNTLYNTRPRNTVNPVTPIDIVAASKWQILDNFIADFVKAGGNRISYAAFIKGGGSGGRFERNIVVCALTLKNQPGLRVGLSFGGGGTGGAYFRDGDGRFEHDGGFAANNVVAHCNDFGIDVNRSKNITIAHNTLVNTAGIDLRNYPASAAISNNLLEGRIRHRFGAWSIEADNWQGDPRDLMPDADRLDLEFARRPRAVPSLPVVAADICGHLRGNGTIAGAVAADAACLRKRVAN